jgi:sugar phosphate permease
MLGGSLPGLVNKRLGWGGVFQMLAVASFLAALLLLPRWNAQPPTSSAKAEGKT